MKKRIKNEKGLTLIELLAVVVILSIVAAIAVPAIGNIIENSRSKAVIADAQNVMSGASLYFADVTVAENTGVAASAIKTAGYLESVGKLTDVTVTKLAAGNKISFKATVKGKTEEFSGLTLQDLSGATFDGGIITIGTTKYGD